MLTRFVGSLFLNLVVGGVLVTAAPGYADSVVHWIRDDPFRAIVAGIVALVLFLGIMVIFTPLGPLVILGLSAAIPIVIVGIIGGALGTVAVGTVVADLVTDGTLWHGVVIGAVFVAVMNSIPVLGGLVTFLVSSAGVGIVWLRIYENW